MQTALKDSEKITSKAISILDIAKEAMQNIQANNKRSNALCFIANDVETQAKILDDELAENKARGPLHGLVAIIKDNIDVEGMPSTIASPVFADSLPKTTDSVLAAQLKSAGMLIAGKANMDEFAAHISGKTSFFGPAINPYSDEKVQYSPGGSSSGVSVSVAENFCHLGVGTDTGGSVRIPAAWCGLYGIRPTQGLTNVYGVFPRAHSLDCIGFFTRTIKDMDLFFTEIMAPATQNTKEIEIKKMIVPENIFTADCDPEVIADFKQVMEKWQSLGIEVLRKEMPEYAEDLSAYVNIVRAYEFAHTAGKYIRSSTRGNEIHPVVLADLEYGETIHHEDYLMALKKKCQVMAHMENILPEDTIILSPVTPCLPPSLELEVSYYAIARKFVNFASFTGLPTLVIPSGKSKQGLPIGFQIIGKAWNDHALIKLAHKF